MLVLHSPAPDQIWRAIDSPAIKCRICFTATFNGRLASVQYRRTDMPGVLEIDADEFLESWEFERAPA